MFKAGKLCLMWDVVYFSVFDLIQLRSKDESLGVYENPTIGHGPRGYLPGDKSVCGAEEGVGFPLLSEPPPAPSSNVTSLTWVAVRMLG